MKQKRIAALALGALIAGAAFGGCTAQRTCSHEFINSITAQPSCEETGTMLNTCRKCGITKTETIPAAGHTYSLGECLICGKERPTDRPPVAEDFSAFHTMKDIYDEGRLLSMTMSEDEFYRAAYNEKFSGIYVDKNGSINVTANGISVNLGKLRCNYPVTAAEPPKTVVGISVDNGKLNVYYTDGTSNDFGLIDVYDSAQPKALSAAAVNMQNELLLLTPENAVLKAGVLATSPHEGAKKTVMHERFGDAFHAVGTIDDSIGTAEIAGSHLGREVTRIAEYAFRGYKNLRSVTIGEGVKYIDLHAFANCDLLTEIRLPASLQSVDYGAFSQCPSLKKVIFNGTAEQWQAVRVADGGNEPLSRVVFAK